MSKSEWKLLFFKIKRSASPREQEYSFSIYKLKSSCPNGRAQYWDGIVDREGSAHIYYRDRALIISGFIVMGEFAILGWFI